MKKTYAIVGDIAPVDIIVPAGDTGIPPGPAIGTLTKAGIKASIQGSIRGRYPPNMERRSRARWTSLFREKRH